MVLAQALNWNTPESQQETVPTICPHTGNVLVSWLRLDNRGHLATRLGLTADEAEDFTDPDYVLAAYRKWGADTARHLKGDYAFAVWDPQRRRLYLARDPLGIRPLFYARTEELFAFTTTLACLREVPGLDVSPSKKWLTYYLAGLSLTYPGLTPFDCATEVSPGHQVIVLNGLPTSTRYHEFRDDPPWARSIDAKYPELYRADLERAVAVRARSAYPLGAENSGGLDSASVIAVLRGFVGAEGQVQTYGKPQFTEDERFMRLAIQGTSFGLHLFETPDLNSELQHAIEAAEVLGHPPQFPNTFTWRPFVKLAAARGVRTILSGHGGDECVTASGELVARELALRWEVAALHRLLGRRGVRGVARTARYSLRQHRRVPYTVKLRAAALRDLEARGLSEDAVESFGVREHVLELSEWSAVHDTLNSFILTRLLWGAATVRAAETSQVAFSNGVEYRYPLLDPDLIQRYLSTPAIEKRGPGVARYLHRRALTGTLDETIRTSRTKNEGVALPRPRVDRYLAYPFGDLRGTPVDFLLGNMGIEQRDAAEPLVISARSSLRCSLAVLLGSLKVIDW